MSIPDAKMQNQIAQTIESLDQDVEQWCYDNNYQQILDIDIKKQNFHERELSKRVDMQFEKKESLLEAKESHDNLKKSKAQIHKYQQ